MKICTTCKELNDEGQFFFQSKSKSHLHAECKDCYRTHRKDYAAAHYKKYGDQYRLRAKIRRAQIKEALQEKMLAYLEDKSCMICGEDDLRVLDFDHLDPQEKTVGIAKAIANGSTWDAILCEIKKCRILCANCHRKHTATQYNWYKNVSKV